MCGLKTDFHISGFYFKPPLLRFSFCQYCSQVSRVVFAKNIAEITLGQWQEIAPSSGGILFLTGF